MTIDERSDFEACRLLTDNAENLSTAISKALYHTQSASIRVTTEKREELGLTHVTETDRITDKPSYHHRVSVATLCLMHEESLYQCTYIHTGQK